MSKKTVIFGATTNPQRYAYLAAERLTNHQHEIILLGIKKGEVFGQKIIDINGKPDIEDVDTITMYVGPQNQKEWEDYLLSLLPKRIIFNPGGENPSLERKAQDKGIEVLEACTLVMLASGQF